MQRQAAPNMEMKAEQSGELTNEMKLDMHTYGYRCVMKQSGAFLALQHVKYVTINHEILGDYPSIKLSPCTVIIYLVPCHSQVPSNFPVPNDCLTHNIMNDPGSTYVQTRKCSCRKDGARSRVHSLAVRKTLTTSCKMPGIKVQSSHPLKILTFFVVSEVFRNF